MLPGKLPELKSIPLRGKLGLLTASCHSWHEVTGHSPNRSVGAVLFQVSLGGKVNKVQQSPCCGNSAYLKASPSTLETVRQIYTCFVFCRVLNSTMFESWAIVGPYPSWWLFNFLLLILQVLHLIWSYLIARIAVKALLRGKVSPQWSVHVCVCVTALPTEKYKHTHTF